VGRLTDALLRASDRGKRVRVLIDDGERLTAMSNRGGRGRMRGFDIGEAV
jgi:hypothetical protein